MVQLINKINSRQYSTANERSGRYSYGINFWFVNLENKRRRHRTKRRPTEFDALNMVWSWRLTRVLPGLSLQMVRLLTPIQNELERISKRLKPSNFLAVHIERRLHTLLFVLLDSQQFRQPRVVFLESLDLKQNRKRILLILIYDHRIFSSKLKRLKGSLSPSRNDIYGGECHAWSKLEN